VKATILSIATYLVVCENAAECQTRLAPAYFPIYDHIVIVVEENKDTSEILGRVGQESATYINGV
jgi:hypothetical protein